MIYFNEKTHGHAIAARAETPFNPEVDVVISRENESKTCFGGVIYKDYTHASIAMHVAGRGNWINRDMLWVCFHYPFIQLGCEKIFGPVPEHNNKAIEFDRKLGFMEETRIENVYPQGGLLILSMRREDCRWLNLKPRELKGNF